jgi:hypothetical protein
MVVNSNVDDGNVVNDEESTTIFNTFKPVSNVKL